MFLHYSSTDPGVRSISRVTVSRIITKTPGPQSSSLAGSIHYMVVSEEECASLTFIDNTHARQSSALMNFTSVVEKTYLRKKKIRVQQARGNLYVQCTQTINLQQG